MIFERKEAHRAPKNNDAAFQTSSLTVSDEIECPDTVDMIETFKEIDLLPPQRKFSFCNPFVCCQNSSSDSDLPEDSDLYKEVDAAVSSAYPCHSDSKDILSQDASSVLYPQDDMPALAKDHSDSSWAADHSTENAIALTERTFHDASRILFRLAHLLFSLIFVESMMGRKKQKKDFVDTLQTKDKPAQDQKEPVPEIISS